eukprot:SAG22_NODE_17_length_32684_cov_34.234095_13_plen_105_part_00
MLSCAQLAARDAASQPARVTWPVSQGDGAVCGESDAGLGEDYTVNCFPAATWPEARAICDGTGARLCTVEELQGDVTAGTGCNMVGQTFFTACPSFAISPSHES